MLGGISCGRLDGSAASLQPLSHVLDADADDPGAPSGVYGFADQGEAFESPRFQATPRHR